MNPLDAIMQYFRGPGAQNVGAGQAQVPASAAPAPQGTPLDWLTQFHNLLAAHSGGLLSPTSVYSNKASDANGGISWQDIAADAARRAGVKHPAVTATK